METAMDDRVGRDPETRDFTQLPERVEIADTVATQVVGPPADPAMGRDPDMEFLLRNADD
ncbi:heme biosynthesis protein HemY [Cellulomonas carbonis T26]|uniref:Heme biosynthesis protein HemY n=2 Tax=Cellulomonas carbonis TaxID=1386092 RepID=A0A0A0BRM7_9CELL|nr:heme biosynthesis protein HemY [Cellulomonas carbonis T26]